jgi:Holliday junction resolvasome RuvABC ATP-dependent DNA helicase subunit
MSSGDGRKGRVESWPGVVGQDSVKEQLELHLEAARRASRPLENVMLVGPDRCGKATFARALAVRCGKELTTVKLPMSYEALLYPFRINNGELVFLDNVDKLSKRDQELAAPIVQSGVLSDRRGRTYEIPNLTVVASATRREKVSDALADAFLVRATFSPYTEMELQQILRMLLRREKLTLVEADRMQLAAAIKVPGEIPRIIKATRELIEAGREANSESILQLAGLEPPSSLAQTKPRRETISDDVKIFVWRRDEGACVKCGSNIDLEFDHIIPVALGGSNTARNLQVLCEKCNRAKGARLV